MIKKAVILLTLLLLFALPVSAATGVISIHAPAGSELTLYRIGQQNDQQVELTEVFAPSRVTLSQLHDPEAALLLAAFAQKNAVPVGIRCCDEQETALFDNLRQGVYLVVQTKTAEGFEPIAPFLFSIPEGDRYAVDASPKVQTQDSTVPETATPQTGDRTQALMFPAATAAIFSFVGLVLCLISQKNRR